MGGFGEAGSSMGLLCRPLQRDSGSLRLPLPGEVGLEISYQPQRTWFPNHPKSGFVLYFSPSLSFFFFLPSRLPLSRWLAGFPAPPCTSRPPLPQLSLLRLRAGCFPLGEGKACRAAGGHAVAYEGTIPASPALEKQGDRGRSLGWRLGYRGEGHPRHTSHLQIPEPHPCQPNRAGARAQARPQTRWERQSPARGCSQVSLERLDVTGEILACRQQTARLPLERGPSPAAQAQMFPNLACAKWLLKYRDMGGVISQIQGEEGKDGHERRTEGDAEALSGATCRF